MTQRVTRQYISVLGPGSGKLRVTRQYAYVLLALTAPSCLDYLTLDQTVGYTLVPGTKSISDSMTLNDTATGEVTSSLYPASDSMTLNETVTLIAEFNRSISDSMTLNEVVTLARTILVSVDDTFSLSDAGSPTYTATIDESMLLEDSVGNFHIVGDFYPASDILTFEESVVAEKPTERYIYDSFSFTETAEGYNATKHADVFQSLAMVETAFGVNPTIRETISEQITLSDIVGRAFTYGITDSMTLSDTLAQKNALIIDSLTLSETITQGRSHSISPDSVSFLQTVTCNASYLRDATDSLAIGHSLTYFVISGCTDRQFSPFIGESTITGLPTAPSVTLPAVVGLPLNTRFQLAYPAAGAYTAVIHLPAPEFENRDRINATRINRETRGGKLTVFADPEWPKINTVACTFTGLTTAEVEAYQEFVANYIGLEINITDWEGREWVGVITAPNEPATHDGKDDWTVSFEFEGVLVERVPNNSLSFNEVVTFEVV